MNELFMNTNMVIHIKTTVCRIETIAHNFTNPTISCNCRITMHGKRHSKFNEVKNEWRLFSCIKNWNLIQNAEVTVFLFVGAFEH